MFSSSLLASKQHLEAGFAVGIAAHGTKAATSKQARQVVALKKLHVVRRSEHVLVGHRRWYLGAAEIGGRDQHVAAGMSQALNQIHVVIEARDVFDQFG